MILGFDIFHLDNHMNWVINTDHLFIVPHNEMIFSKRVFINIIAREHMILSFSVFELLH